MLTLITLKKRVLFYTIIIFLTINGINTKPKARWGVKPANPCYHSSWSMDHTTSFFLIYNISSKICVYMLLFVWLICSKNSSIFSLNSLKQFEHLILKQTSASTTIVINTNYMNYICALKYHLLQFDLFQVRHHANLKIAHILNFGSQIQAI